MANPIVPKFNANTLSTAAPGALANLTTGELASNLTTGRLYLKLHDGSIADVVPVKTVNTQTGDVVITTQSIGALGVGQLGAANGVAGLGADGKLVSSQLPTIQTSNLGCLTTDAVAGLVPQLDSTGKISMSQIPSSLQGALNYQGIWNADTNFPALASGVGSKGHYYVVSVAGSTNLDGHTGWLVGDLVIFDGSTWDKVSGNDSEVISVNGQTPNGSGNITLTPANIGAISSAAINAINGVAGLNGSAQIGTAQLPAATTASIGAISVGDNLTVDGSGRLSAIQGTYTLPAATTASLGGIIAGSGLAIQLNGTLSAPVATASDAGIVKPGTGLLVDGSGVLSVDNTVVITTSTSATVFNGGTY